MAMPANDIQQMIEDAIPDAKVHIDDLMGDGDHYAVHVISSAFESKSRIQQHQMVYAALQGRVGGQLHALSVRTSTPSPHNTGNQQ
jgi:stress-induced morphogen